MYFFIYKIPNFLYYILYSEILFDLLNVNFLCYNWLSSWRVGNHAPPVTKKSQKEEGKKAMRNTMTAIAFALGLSVGFNAVPAVAGPAKCPVDKFPNCWQVPAKKGTGNKPTPGSLEKGGCRKNFFCVLADNVGG